MFTKQILTNYNTFNIKKDKINKNDNLEIKKEIEEKEELYTH